MKLKKKKLEKEEYIKDRFEKWISPLKRNNSNKNVWIILEINYKS